jgi:hypothetical protein
MSAIVRLSLRAAAPAILVGLMASPAGAVFLSDLIGPPPQTLSSSSIPPAPAYTVIGSSWSYTHTGNVPEATAINVTSGPDFAGFAGFEFQGPFHDDPGGGDSDALIQYQVSLSAADIAAGRYFTDVHLESDLTVVDGSTTNLGNIAIVETVRDQNGNLIGTLTNFDIWTNVGQSFSKEATLFLDPTKHYTVLNISKDILISSDGGTATPQVSHIDQTYSVPEPSSLSVTALGLASAALGGVFRRQMLRASRLEGASV